MPKDLVEIKTYLDDKVGQEILVTVQMGRKKRKQRRGILQDTFHSVFVVALDQDENSFDRASYSYRDVLTNAIELQFI